VIGRPCPVVWPTDLSALDPPSSLPHALRYAPLAPAPASRVLDPVAGDPFGDLDVDTRPATAPRAVPERGTLPARCDAVIVNYNAGALLARAVASLQRSPRVARIVVVDNASVDDSLARLEAECADATRLTVLRSAANLGFARGCNLGAARTDAPFVLYLNPDCVVADDAVELLLETLAARPEAGMAGPMIVNPDGSEQAGARRAIPTPWRSFVRAFGLSRLSARYPRLFSDFLLHSEPVPDRPTRVEAISGACMLVRRESLAGVGLLDEGYFMHCEDLDWCMRFRMTGWQVLFVPQARVTHVKGTSSRSRPVFVEWHKHAGMIRFYRKFFRHQYPGALMWFVSVGVWLRFGGVATYHLARRLVGR